jgi:hypothetical protein
MFNRYVGIDYSGRLAPVSRIAELQVFSATPTSNPEPILVPSAGAQHWCRKDLAAWCIRELMRDSRSFFAIDHGFSFPAAYMRRHELTSWNQFLHHLHGLWPTDRDHMYVDFVRKKNPPSGAPHELRLCEQWTESAGSVFDFIHPGAFAYSTHAGIVWLHHMRQHPGLLDRVHFWPFDGFDVPMHKSVVAETSSSLFHRRFAGGDRGRDEHEAYSVAMWLKQVDGRSSLEQYLNPPLTPPERQIAEIEGWIIGVY